MKKIRIIISTVLPDVRYTQLGIYNLKAYALRYSKYKKCLDIQLYEIEAEHHRFLHGTTFPVIDKKILFNKAVVILKKKPRVIGFSCFMWNIDLVLQLCKIIKSIDPVKTVILGGPEASTDPKNLLSQNRCVDMVVRDEGEATFTEIIDQLLSGKADFSQIKGLFYRNGCKIIQNPYRPPLNLNKLPSPYLTGLVNFKRNTSLALETSRGCPFHCAYCTYSIRGYHQLRFFPLKKVLSEISLVLSKNPKKVRIMDDNFNINPNRTARMLKQIAKYNKQSNVKIFLNSSMWNIDDKLIRLLQKCNIICSVGVQSIDDQVLKLISRDNRRSILENNLGRFKKYKLKYELSFILGLPGENYEQIKESIDWAFRFNPEEINLFPLMLFKGTRLARDAHKLGLVYRNRPFYVIKRTDVLSENLIKKGVDLKESVGLLYNQGLLKKTIRVIASKLECKFTKIVEEFGKIIRSQKKEHNIKTFQKKLIKEFILNHKSITISQLNEYVQDDLTNYLERSN